MKAKSFKTYATLLLIFVCLKGFSQSTRMPDTNLNPNIGAPIAEQVIQHGGYPRRGQTIFNKPKFRSKGRSSGASFSTYPQILKINDLIYLSDASNKKASDFLTAKEYALTKTDEERKWNYYDYLSNETGTLRVIKLYDFSTASEYNITKIPASLFYVTRAKKYIEIIEKQLLSYKQKTEVSPEGIIYYFYSYKNKKISISISDSDNTFTVKIYN